MKPSMNRKVIVDQTELPDNNQMDINSYESMVNLTSICLVSEKDTCRMWAIHVYFKLCSSYILMCVSIKVPCIYI